MRAEMGYPIIVTPVSQQVATQAVRNVIDQDPGRTCPTRPSVTSSGTSGRRLRRWTDVAERVLSRPRANELRGLEPVRLEGARARFGRISDEELLLRLTMPQEQVDAIGSPEPMRAPPRVSASVGREGGPHKWLLEEVAGRPAITHVRVETGDELVEWRRSSRTPG